jgi:hypothetical protein
MAKELARKAVKAIAVKSGAAIKKHAKKAAKKHAKKAAKKHAEKKHAKKAAKHASSAGSPRKNADAAFSVEKELQRAFHHLQRASAVISLIEAESGGDLKVLLHHGIERYRDASDAPRLERTFLRAAVGLLRAAEHLAMAGLYAARGVHQLNIEVPPTDEIEAHAQSLGPRLAKLNPGTAYGLRLHAMVYELVKRAEGADHDPHLAWELVMGADGICAALEAGVE